MKFLVPYDFTAVTRNALEHALHISDRQGAEVELLHIISQEDQRQEAEDKFTELVDSLDPQLRQRVFTSVRLGDIFHDINREAEQEGARLLVMGTHGAKGLQKVFGSKAIKVISSSSAPFLITQNQGPRGSIKHIVLAIDLTNESLQILRFALGLAKSFQARVDLVCRPQSDEFLQHKMQNNITKARRFLLDNGLESDFHLLPGKKAFHREVIDYGAKHQADLFAIAHFPESLIPQFDQFSQAMITNEAEIPVLIINARQVASVNSNYSFISI